MGKSQSQTKTTTSNPQATQLEENTPKLNYANSLNTGFGGVNSSASGTSIGDGSMGDQAANTRVTAQNTQNQAAGNLSTYLSQLSNPQQAEQQAQQTYANYANPAYNLAAQQYMGQAIAGLGNRYSGTYGQLTADQAANQNAIGAANNAMNIYNAGQTWLNNQYNNLGTLGGVYSNAANATTQATNNEMTPYTTLANIWSNAQNANNGYNSGLTNIYGTQAGLVSPQSTVSGSTSGWQFNPTVDGSSLGGNMGGSGGGGGGSFTYAPSTTNFGS